MHLCWQIALAHVVILRCVSPMLDGSESLICLNKMSYGRTQGIPGSDKNIKTLVFVFVLWPLSLRLLLYLGTRGGWVSSAPGCLW